MAKIGDTDWRLTDFQKSELINGLGLGGDHYSKLVSQLFDETEKQMRLAELPSGNGRPLKQERFDKLIQQATALQSTLSELDGISRAFLDSEVVPKASLVETVRLESESSYEPSLSAVLDSLKKQTETYVRNHKGYLSKWEMVLEHCFIAYWALVSHDAWGIDIESHPDSTRKRFQFAHSRKSLFVKYCLIVLNEDESNPLIGEDSIKNCLKSAGWYQRRMRAFERGIN
ncbi:hypothetical protein ACFOD0_04210 [Shewanella intestini]|uniref:Uncharacterized protein n=1 Tax=Shewanella intestini TaxID=2017544 RepID=A0ABS5I0R0_9GAMM|nr:MULTISPECIES: hypothetical protein [Shewanella]MBR9727506.1 hypothetical protein [Shewanella intestini]MRG35344.1 hypothetical protein [Shewanella sp. XMDDZSB0408]